MALVTGGGGGIGEATVRLFYEEGGRVAVVDSDADAADADSVVACDESSYVTGATFMIDGGLSV